MPAFRVTTPARAYDAVIERGILGRAGEFVPQNAGAVFVVTTEDVWNLHGARLRASLEAPNVLLFPGGETRKRLAQVEALADQMALAGADRTSIVIGFGGGIVTDLAGFLASIFMRGVPILQIPTTLLAQVDAAVGGKTGANLASAKNLIGTFHQPMAVLIDPDVIATLSDREYRAGLQEIVKCGVIQDPDLFAAFETGRERVLNRDPALLDELIAGAVRIKADVVSRDEKESDLRRILNFGHTIGHALEAETSYSRFLHGEAVAFGMVAATRLAVTSAGLDAHDARRIITTVRNYGPIPPVDDIVPARLFNRLSSDKKTLHGNVHFVLPEQIGAVRIVTGIPEQAVLDAIDWTIASYSTARAMA